MANGPQITQINTEDRTPLNLPLARGEARLLSPPSPVGVRDNLGRAGLHSPTSRGAVCAAPQFFTTEDTESTEKRQTAYLRRGLVDRGARGSGMRCAPRIIFNHEGHVGHGEKRKR